MKKPAEYNVGDDVGGNTISLILVQSHEGIVFKATDGSIGYAVNGNDQKSSVTRAIAQYHVLFADNPERNDKSNEIWKNVLLMSVGLEHEHLDIYLSGIKTTWKKEDETKLRLSHLAIWLICTAISSFFCLVFFVLCENFPSEIISNITDIALYFTLGVYGGFISVSSNLSKLDATLLQSKSNSRMSGLLRVLMTGILGILAALAIKSEYFLKPFADSNVYGILFICAIAGFSESFIPNLLRKEAENSQKGAS